MPARCLKAEEDAERVRQDLVLNVHAAYYGFVATLEAKAVTERNLSRSEDHTRLAMERKAAGAVPQADVIRAQVEVANARLSLVRAEDMVRVSRGKLNTVMGLPVEMPVEVDARPQEVAPPDSAGLLETLDRAVQMRPELKAARQRVAAARSATDAARSAFGPKVKLEGGYGCRDAEAWPRDQDWSAGVSLDMPVFTGFSRMHRLSKTKAEASRAEAEAEQLALGVRQEVWTAQSKLQEAYEATRASEILVREAEEGVRLAQERYRAGAGTVNDLLDAQTALARAEAGRVEAQWDYHVARATFNRAVGELGGPVRP